MTARPLDPMLTAVFDTLSRRLAGGFRTHPEDMLGGADDPNEGIVPDEYRPDISSFEWMDPTVWAASDPNQITAEDIAAMGIAPTGPGTAGSGRDFFRSGEAPSNYTNRHNPLYEARRDFAQAINGQIEELFGVNGGGVGYLREPKASDAAPGGRSANSDHYSGGANDYYGTVEQLDALAAWAQTQPFVSFIRWRSESHGGPSGTEQGAHLHMSFDLGWVAQNYFTERQAPTLPPMAKPSSPETETSRVNFERNQPTAPPPEPEPITQSQTRELL